MLNDLWKKVIVLSEVLNKKAEDAHLNAKGFEFYSIHEAMVKIQDGLGDDDTAFSDIPDSAQELYFGGRGLPFVSSNEIAKEVVEALPKQTNNVKDLIKQIRDVLDELLDVLSEILDDKETSLGENDFCASLSKELQHRRYFLNAIIG